MPFQNKPLPETAEFVYVLYYSGHGYRRKSLYVPLKDGSEPKRLINAKKTCDRYKEDWKVVKYVLPDLNHWHPKLFE